MNSMNNNSSSIRANQYSMAKFTNETNGLVFYSPIVVNDVNAVLEEAPLDKSGIKIKNELIQSSNHTNLINFINRLNPSESDLGLNLNEYIFSECLKIYNKINDSQVTLGKTEERGLLMFLMGISENLFGEYSEKSILGALKGFGSFFKGDNTTITLSLVASLGKGLLDMPLHVILSRKSSYGKGTPEERILNSMKICIDWIYIIVKYTSSYLKYNNEMVGALKNVINRHKNNLKFVDIKGFNENSLDFSKLENIRENFKIVNETIDENTVDQLHNSGVVSDHTYLKFKCKFNVYAGLKNVREKVESINVVMTRKCAEMIKLAENSQTATPKKNIKGLTRKCDIVDTEGYKIFSSETEIFETMPRFIRTHAILLETCLTIINARFSKLCKDYEAIRGEKTDVEINKAMANMLFGDELSTSNTHAKKSSAPTVNNTNNVKNNNQQISIKGKNNTQVTSKKGQASGNKGKVEKQSNVDGKIHVALPPVVSNKILSPEQILSDHSQYIYTLAKAIKKDLISKTSGDAKFSGIELNRSQIHTKELKTHLQYAFLNFDLFCKAIQSQDLYALGAIVPFLCMDLHTSLEQMQKRQILMKKMQPCASHQLSELYANSKCALSPDQRSFIDEFSDAMLQARYPVSHAYKGPNGEVSEPLKWMQYSQKLCEAIANGRENTVDSNELAQLCDFVFNSYSMTLQCVLQELNIEPKISESTKQQSEMILNLKKAVLGSISDNKDDLITQAIKLKNLAPSNKNAKPAPKSYGKTKKVQISEKNAKSILEISQNICEVGDGILKRFDDVEANRLEKILNETTSLLGRIDAVDYLQKKYDNMRYAALHHRNLLMFQWIYEHLYRFNGHLEGLNDLRWVCNHNLEAFHALAFPEVPLPLNLKEFNFIRNVHYNHEEGHGQSLSMMKNLLKTRKTLNQYDYEGWLRSTSKKDMAAKLESHRAEFAENRSTILMDGKALSESLLKMTATR